MKDILGWLGVVFFTLIRVPLIIFGLFWVFLSVLGDGYKWTPWMFPFFADAESTPKPFSESRGGVWWYWAVRNPTRGLGTLFTQPIPEPHPNPDKIVRSGEAERASRYISGLQPEYWYLRKAGDEYFEFRVGWKYTTGGRIDFYPTIQFRKGG